MKELTPYFFTLVKPPQRRDRDRGIHFFNGPTRTKSWTITGLSQGPQRARRPPDFLIVPLLAGQSIFSLLPGGEAGFVSPQGR